MRQVRATRFRTIETTDLLLLRLPNSAKSKIDAAKIPTQVQFEEWAPNFAWPAGGWRRYQAGMSHWSRPTLDDADDRYVDDHYQHDGDAVEQHAHSADDQSIIGIWHFGLGPIGVQFSQVSAALRRDRAGRPTRENPVVERRSKASFSITRSAISASPYHFALRSLVTNARGLTTGHADVLSESQISTQQTCNPRSLEFEIAPDGPVRRSRVWPRDARPILRQRRCWRTPSRSLLRSVSGNLAFRGSSPRSPP